MATFWGIPLSLKGDVGTYVSTGNCRISEWFYQLACQQLLDNTAGTLLVVMVVLNGDGIETGGWASHCYFKVFELLPDKVTACANKWESWVTSLEVNDNQAYEDLAAYTNGDIAFCEIKGVIDYQLALSSKKTNSTSANVQAVSSGNSFDILCADNEESKKQKKLLKKSSRKEKKQKQNEPDEKEDEPTKAMTVTGGVSQTSQSVPSQGMSTAPVPCCWQRRGLCLCLRRRKNARL
jgi:hypothetical protein